MTQSILAVLGASMASWALGFAIGKLIRFVEQLLSDAVL